MEFRQKLSNEIQSDPIEIANDNYNIATIYHKLNNPNKTLEFFLKALEV